MSVQSIIDEMRDDAQKIAAMTEKNIARVASLPEAWLSQVPAIFKAEEKGAENFVKANYGWFILGTAIVCLAIGHFA